MNILNLYISSDHNYVGHHGQSSGKHPILERESLECVAGRGIKGDRYYDHKANFKGQITFFSDEIRIKLQNQLGVEPMEASVFRRNVIVEGTDLNTLIGKEFEVQGIRFLGTEECRPCYWMDEAFSPGAHEALKGNGGLRARILSSGTLGCNSKS